MRSSPDVGERRGRFVQDLLTEERGRRSPPPLLWAGDTSIGGSPSTSAATTLQLRLLPLYVAEPCALDSFVVGVTGVAGAVRVRVAIWQDEYEPPAMRLLLAGFTSEAVLVGGVGALFLPVSQLGVRPVLAGNYHVGVVATIAGGGALTLRSVRTAGGGGFARTMASFDTLPASLRWQDLTAAAGFVVGLCTAQGRRILEGL